MAKDRHEGCADIAREMVRAKEPITREQVAGWARRLADIGIWGARQVTILRARIRQQRDVARSYCRYIAKLEARITELNNQVVPSSGRPDLVIIDDKVEVKA